jgi:hypothetical protein
MISTLAIINAFVTPIRLIEIPVSRVRARDTWALHPKVSCVPYLIIRAIAAGP